MERALGIILGLSSILLGFDAGMRFLSSFPSLDPLAALESVLAPLLPYLSLALLLGYLGMLSRFLRDR